MPLKKLKGCVTMKIIREMNLNDFTFWGGAVKTANRIKALNLMDMAQEFIEELYPDGIDESTLNDEFWFNDSDIYQAVGIDEDDEDDEDSEDYFYQSKIDDEIDEYLLNR